MTRIFKTLVNFRDLGGIPLENGKTVKRKRILRCGEIVGLCQDDKQLLTDDYGLKTIVDFRSKQEIKEKPDDVFDGVKYCNFDVLYDLRQREKGLTSSQKDLEKMSTLEDMLDHMKQVYNCLIFDESAVIGYRKFIDEFLALDEGSLAFHCYAGKDRTGIAAAIILVLLGADEQAIFEDYMLTNKLREEANKKLWELLVETDGVENLSKEGFDMAVSVDEKFLRHAYEVAEDKYGSFYNYAVSALNVKKDEIERLKQLYTE